MVSTRTVFCMGQYRHYSRGILSWWDGVSTLPFAKICLTLATRSCTHKQVSMMNGALLETLNVTVVAAAPYAPSCAGTADWYPRPYGATHQARRDSKALRKCMLGRVKYTFEQENRNMAGHAMRRDVAQQPARIFPSSYLWCVQTLSHPPLRRPLPAARRRTNSPDGLLESTT